jgi:hypothetical protein
MACASTAPAVAPMAPRISPSVTNRRRIPARRTPIARAEPISVVRSITLMPIVFTTVKRTMTLMMVAMNRKMARNIPTACV